MNGLGVVASIDGTPDFINKPKRLHDLLIANGCTPYAPVIFLGCNAAAGDNSFAKRFADEIGVPTVGATNYTWWNETGIAGIYGRKSSNSNDLDYHKPDQGNPGRWKVFKP
jgi:hypothetical protein